MNLQTATRVKDALAREPEERVIRLGASSIACSIWQPEKPPVRAPWVMLVHGNAASRHWWDAVAPYLALGFRVAAPDLSGHGDSSRMDEYTLESWAGEILGLKEELCPGDPLTLVGHSMGGLIALKAAWDSPPAVRQLVLLDTPLRRQSEEVLAKRERLGRRPLRRFAERADAVAAFKTVPLPAGAPAELMRHLAEHSVAEVQGGWQFKVDPKIYLRRTVVQEFLQPWPNRTTLIRAESGLVDEAMAAEAKALLGHTGELINQPGVGHNLLLEDPYGTYLRIAAALS